MKEKYQKAKNDDEENGAACRYRATKCKTQPLPTHSSHPRRASIKASCRMGNEGNDDSREKEEKKMKNEKKEKLEKKSTFLQRLKSKCFAWHIINAILR